MNTLTHERGSIFEEYKPSEVIEICLEALNAFKDKDNFVFDMMSFGRISEDGNQTCYGCLATAFVFYFFEEEPSDYNIDYKHHPTGAYEYMDIQMIEEAIDCLRIGDLETFLWHWGQHVPEVAKRNIVDWCNTEFDKYKETYPVHSPSFFSGDWVQEYKFFSTDSMHIAAFKERMTIINKVLTIRDL
mgnify:CR=1 FL=1